MLHNCTWQYRIVPDLISKSMLHEYDNHQDQFRHEPVLQADLESFHPFPPAYALCTCRLGNAWTQAKVLSRDSKELWLTSSDSRLVHLGNRPSGSAAIRL